MSVEPSSAMYAYAVRLILVSSCHSGSGHPSLHLPRLFGWGEGLNTNQHWESASVSRRQIISSVETTCVENTRHACLFRIGSTVRLGGCEGA